MLGLLFTAQHSNMVEKLILISCGTFSAEDSAKIDHTRLGRLSETERQQVQEILKNSGNKLERLIEIFLHVDVYEGMTRNLEISEYQDDLFNKVWSDFQTLRDTPSYIANEFSKIKIPVVLIQGDYDPHSVDYIYPFLKKYIQKIDVHVLEKCGHYPCIERYARDPFFELLKSDL